MLYQILIAPIEAVMRVVLSGIYGAIGSYGVSIFFLSLLINVVLFPLFQMAERWQEAERKVQKILKPKLQEFRQAFSGEERHVMIHTLYRQAGYHPIYAMRSSFGLFLQLPFWIAAYQLLSQYQPLEGASFLFFEDLGKPDKLLWGINLLPFVMTAVNLLAAFLYTSKLSVSEKIQPLLLALLFLVLLYNSPAGLLLYWTFNSLFSLLRIALTRSRDVGQVAPIAAPYQKHVTSKSGLGTTRSQNRREFFQLCQKILESPYVLALLTGLWPIAFYISNNWFMFEASRSLFIIVTVTSIIWFTLSLFYLVLSWLWRTVFNPSESKAVLRIFVFVSILVMAYLLRRTFLPMAKDSVIVFIVVLMLMASTVAWFAPRIQIFRLNCVLGILCILQLGMGLNSIISTKLSPTILFDTKEGALRQTLYDQVRFSQKPNVYLIVPDGYPNAEGLKTIFNLDTTDFYEQVKLLGFRIHPSNFSNYMATLASISSLLGMDHHYYRGNIGNFEFLNARKFIVSDQNPVVHIFRNNGYQIHYVHETQWLFSSGCFVDSCWPMLRWSELNEILVAPSLKSIPLLARVTEAIAARRVSKDDEQARRSEFMQRALEHIDLMSEQHIPHFTYMHMIEPNHSFPGEQTSEQLTSFRKDYVKKIQIANDEILSIVSHIQTRDPNALIIVNADHGAWGYGSFNYTKKEILESTSDDLMALDHLGALLALRWPDAAPQCDQDLRTNVNVFRCIFSYLTESKDIWATKVPDHSFIERSGRGEQQVVRKAIHDGEVLRHMVDVDSVTGQAVTRK